MNREQELAELAEVLSDSSRTLMAVSATIRNAQKRIKLLAARRALTLLEGGKLIHIRKEIPEHVPVVDT
jgi:hypothetical protein